MPKEAKKLQPSAPEEIEQAEKVAKVTDEQVEEQKLAATGIKEKVENEEAVAEAETKDASEIVKMPSLFVDVEKRIRVNLEILFDPTDGKVLMVAAVPEKKTMNPLRYLRRSSEWIEFTHPTYDNMIGYRESSMSYDKGTQQYLTDPVKLRLCFLRYHLVDWSLKDDKGEKVELNRINESLSNESMTKVGGVMPAILDVALTEFEKETLLGT